MKRVTIEKAVVLFFVSVIATLLVTGILAAIWGNEEVAKITFSGMVIAIGIGGLLCVADALLNNDE